MTNGGSDRENPPEPRLSGFDPVQRVQRIVEAAEEAAAQIRDEAEAEASRYLEEYKRRVDRLVSERAQLTDTLTEQTDRIKDQYEKFIAALDGALRKVGEVAGNGQPVDRDRREDSPPDVDRDRPREPAPDRAPDIGPDPLSPSDPEALQPSRRPWRPWRSEAPSPSDERDSLGSRVEPHHERRRDPEPRSDNQPQRGAEPPTTPGGYRPRPASQGERMLARQMVAAGNSRAEVEKRLRDEFGIDDAGPLLDELGAN